MTFRHDRGDYGGARFESRRARYEAFGCLADHLPDFRVIPELTP